MFQVARVTDALSSSAVVPFALVLEDFESISYSPRLLLPVSLPDVIIDDAEYVQGCEDGFDFYYEFPEACESLPALRFHIMQELFPGPSDVSSLALRVGCVHGFLSFLAFTDRDLALAGLNILTHLTDHLVFLSKGCL